MERFLFILFVASCVMLISWSNKNAIKNSRESTDEEQAAIIDEL
jgi:hypothetical protein